MAFDIFGFTIRKKSEEEERLRNLLTVVPQTDTEGSITVSSTGAFASSTYYNLDFNTTSDATNINKYREISQTAEIESAIDEIINEVFYIGDNESPINLVLDKIPYSEEVKTLVRNEFDNILTILNFNENAYEIFKKWYVDGRIYFNIVIDPTRSKDGIQELRYVDPRKLKKVKEIVEEKYRGGIRVPVLYNEWYVFEGDTGSLKIPKDSIAASTSGLVDEKNGSVVLSYLHSAIKPYNQLRMMEDATVIYLTARAPERRVFKIDVGNMPAIKAEQHVNNMMNTFRNKVSYDSNTGDIKDDTRTLSMLEDFWFPVREGGRGADVTTLAGGATDFGTTQVSYFQKKLYRALHVPIGRLDEASTFNTGRSADIAREEAKFSKFIQRLRFRFSNLFTDLLKKQLILKNIITLEDWDQHFKNNIFFNYKQDSHFAEFNEAEIISRRMELAQQADGVGRFSERYIDKKILKLTDEEIDEIKADRQVEGKKGSRDVPEFGGDMNPEMGMSEPQFTPSITPSPKLPEIPEPTQTPPTQPQAPENK